MLFLQWPGLSLPRIGQLLIQLVYTLPFSFNENHFPVKKGTFSTQL